MSNVPFILNLNDIGVKANKDISNGILSLYKVHKAGTGKGNGLFARRKIFKNEEVIRIAGPVIGPQVLETLYWSYGIDIGIQIGINKYVLPNNESRFINHSCEPNLGFKSNRLLIAMRNIDYRDELSLDYSMFDIDDDWEIDCVCNTKSCRRKILGSDIFNTKLNLAKKYSGYLPEFVQKELIRKGFKVNT